MGLFVALCWAQNALIFEYVGSRISSRTSSHMRLWLALPLMLLFQLFTEGSLFPQNIPLPLILVIGLSGVLGFFVADSLAMSSYVILGARETMVILTTSPLLSTTMAYLFLHQGLSALQLVGMFITLSSVALVIYSDHTNGSKVTSHQFGNGVLYAFIGAIAQATAYVLVDVALKRDVSPVEANTIRLLFGLAAVVIYTMWRGTFRSDFSRLKGKEGFKYVRLIFLAALVGPVLGIVINLKAFTLAPVGIVTTFNQMTPVLLLPLERLFFKRRASKGALVGTFGAVAGSVLLFL